MTRDIYLHVCLTVLLIKINGLMDYHKNYKYNQEIQNMTVNGERTWHGIHYDHIWAVIFRIYIDDNVANVNSYIIIVNLILINYTLVSSVSRDSHIKHNWFNHTCFTI